MNIDIICKVLIAAEYLSATALLWVYFARHRRHWQTTAAGLVTIIVSLAYESFCFVHLGHFEYETVWMLVLLPAIGNLLASDAQ